MNEIGGWEMHSAGEENTFTTFLHSDCLLGSGKLRWLGFNQRVDASVAMNRWLECRNLRQLFNVCAEVAWRYQ